MTKIIKQMKQKTNAIIAAINIVLNLVFIISSIYRMQII